MAHMSEVGVGARWRARLGGKYCDVRVIEIVDDREGRKKLRLKNLTTGKLLHKLRTAAFLRKKIDHDDPEAVVDDLGVVEDAKLVVHACADIQLDKSQAEHLQSARKHLERAYKRVVYLQREAFTGANRDVRARALQEAHEAADAASFDLSQVGGGEPDEV